MLTRATEFQRTDLYQSSEISPFSDRRVPRDPVLESSPDCKRVASVNIDTKVTRLQSVLETKRVAQLNSKQRSRDSMTSSLTWQVYGPGVGVHNYGYIRRTLARSVSIDS